MKSPRVNDKVRLTEPFAGWAKGTIGIISKVDHFGELITFIPKTAPHVELTLSFCNFEECYSGNANRDIINTAMTIENTLNEREKRYGSFTGNSILSQRFKEVARQSGNWEKLSADKKEALDNGFQKIARLLNGDPEYIDNWHDLVGYFKLVENNLIEAQIAKQSSDGPASRSVCDAESGR